MAAMSEHRHELQELRKIVAIGDGGGLRQVRLEAEDDAGALAEAQEKLAGGSGAEFYRVVLVPLNDRAKAYATRVGAQKKTVVDP